jgi:hypothetical protein
MTLVSHEFFGGADDWHLTAEFLAHYSYSPCDLGVCQVLAIPSQQKINRVNRRHGYMGCVANYVLRKYAGCHNALRQCIRLIRDRERWQAADDCQPLLNLGGIAE